MQNINTKHFGPIAFVKTWVSNDGRHIGKLAKGGYAHLSGSPVTAKKDIIDLIPTGNDQKDAIAWYATKDNPEVKKNAKKIILTPDGGYLWEDGSEITDAVDLYNTLPEGPQLETLLAWFHENKVANKKDEDEIKKQEQKDRMAFARSKRKIG